MEMPGTYEHKVKVKMALKLYHKLDDIQKKLDSSKDPKVKEGLLKNFNKNYNRYKILSDELKADATYVEEPTDTEKTYGY